MELTEVTAHPSARKQRVSKKLHRQFTWEVRTTAGRVTLLVTSVGTERSVPGGVTWKLSSLPLKTANQKGKLRV